MASFAKQFSLFILLIALLHTHARDSQFFNKIPSTTTKNAVVPNTNNETPTPTVVNQQQPDFLPDNENSYGLYGHNTAQLPPSATTLTTTGVKPATTAAAIPYNTEAKQPLPKYLPKNYNPTAYVTQPEDMSDSSMLTEEESYTTTTNPNGNYNNGEQNYYNNQLDEEEEEEKSEYTNNNNNNYYRLGSSFNSQPQGLSDTTWGGAALTSRQNNNNNGEVNGYQPQGMSDTRYFENGKYFYDLNSEKYSSNHPYESLRGSRANNEYNNRNYYANGEFNGVMNSMGQYQNQDEFQVDNNAMP